MNYSILPLLLLWGIFLAKPVLGQWTVQNSGTGNDLLAVDFLDAQNGAAAGRNGTILLTSDGGSTWTTANTGEIKDDFRSIRMISTDTILAAGGTIFEGQLYRSVNGGQSWEALIDVSELSTSELGILGLNYESVFYSADKGESWDTTNADLGGTVLVESLHFADPATGYLVGNISGFSTYSAYGFRTEDGGLTWAPWWVFDFPNNNAWTNFSAPHPDTTYLFTNAFVNFLPSEQNRLVRMTDYYFDTSQDRNSWRFSAEEVNLDMPGTIISSHFQDVQNGYAGSAEGDIYQTENGGQDWTLTYDGDTSIFEIIAAEEDIFYAVGGNGLILKYAVSSRTKDRPEIRRLSLYPNPAGDQLFLPEFPANAATGIIRSIDGRLIRSFQWTKGENIRVSELPRGIYLLEMLYSQQRYRAKIFKM